MSSSDVLLVLGIVGAVALVAVVTLSIRLRRIRRNMPAKRHTNECFAEWADRPCEDCRRHYSQWCWVEDSEMP